MFRILLAEDNKENQSVYRRILEKTGYDIDIAENGKEAVDAFKKSSYDLILMDLQMPEMDGMEAVREIRYLVNGRKVPIVAFTALPSDQHRQACLAQGMNDFLNKPCNEKMLLDCIETWQKRRSVILIVDDMKDSRQLLKHYLRDTPFDFLSARNGVEAIAAFKKEERISLILMDMEMPVMDGYTATRTIRSLAGKKNLPIIAMTAHEGEHELQQCLRAGCTGYLRKPLTRQSIMRVLSEHLKGSGANAHWEQLMESANNNVVEIDPDVAELVPGFLNNRKKDAEEIGRLLAEGNFEAIRIIGHSMAGSAGGYGFPEIGKLGKAIEAAALTVKSEEIRAISCKLSEYLSAVIVKEKKV
ncbi:MAG: response regulator [Nitrospirae bacterium]|nr:response regulator [Nitrospirota bacterium]